MPAPTQKGTSLVRKPAPTFTNHIAVASTWRERDASKSESTDNEDGEVINVTTGDPGVDASGDLVVKSGQSPVKKNDVLAATYPTITGIVGESDDDTLTKAGHGLETGDAVTVTFSAGFTGLTSATTYYAIRTGSNTFKLAATLADAVAGTAIDITADGTDMSAVPVRNYLVMEVENSGFGATVLKQSVQLMFRSKLSSVLS
jgi:hypothetical protein